MKFTNNYNLPQSLVNALKGDDYDLKDIPSNVISVTTLIAPPKVKTLELRHWDEIEVDVSERLWLVIGQSIHHVLEFAAEAEGLSEERWYLDIHTWKVYTLGVGQKIHDAKWYSESAFYISGKLDNYDAKEKDLQDYKITSVYSWIIDKAPKPEWVSQDNINGFAIRLLGFEIKKLSIIAMFKDWSASKAIRDYPELPIPMKVIDIPRWSDDYSKNFILGRVRLHQASRGIKDEMIPECTEEERWAKKTTFAIIKGTNKKALRVHETQEQANLHLAQLGNGHRIEIRPGKDARCEGYCSVNGFCHYFKAKYSIKPNESGEGFLS